MSNLMNHAKREFLALGYKPIEECDDDPNKWIQENVLELLQVFANQGYSGSSATFCIDYFAKLANFLPLAPLTGEDSEWNEVGENVLQNNRCSTVFKDVASGACYTIEGYVFWHWSERNLEEDEEGYPRVKRFKSCFTSNMSRKQVVFPYVPQDPEYVEVKSYEVNKETNEPEPGSGWWHTEYPEHIETHHALLEELLRV